MKNIISKKFSKYIGLIFSGILVLFVCINVYNFYKIPKIERVLNSSDYNYLPYEAKNYIKEYYLNNGQVPLTEKNKEKNKPYLNPRYISYLTLTEEEKKKTGDIPITMITDYVLRDDAEEITVPSKYDITNTYMTEIRNQGKLGICWAFATSGVAESYLIKNKPEISTMQSPLLISERQIDYATATNGIKDYNSEYVSFIERSLGDGGNFYISTIAMANGISLFNYNSFKEYNDNDLTEMELHEVLNYQKSLYEVDSTINFPLMSLRESTSTLTSSEKELRDYYLKEVKKNIMENGSAYVGTYMSDSCQYTDPNLNNLVIDVYNCSVTDGHALQIIGWDDALSYTYCADTKIHNADTTNCKNIVSGKGVWILKNSWGNNTQHPYLTYDSLYSSIHFIDEMAETSSKTWDNNYIFEENNTYIKEKTYYLKDTKIKDNEKLKKIKFITDVTNSEYNIKIYKQDGTYVTYSKTKELPGLLTFDITDDIIVDKNTKIVISGDGEFIDRISIFTSNIDTTPYINLDKYKDVEISESNIRLYSETKNIPSNTELVYKLYNSSNQEVDATFTNNIVAENNINTLLTFTNKLDNSEYRIDVTYNSDVINSVNIKIKRMEGDGTEENPYIITNSTQLYQIKEDLDAHYVLGNDIDLTEDTRKGGKYCHTPSGEFAILGEYGWRPIYGFSGTLDGKGHTIKGLYQRTFLSGDIGYARMQEKNGTSTQYAGLFGRAEGDVTIKNLILEDFDVGCSAECGLLIGYYYNDYSNTTESEINIENVILKNNKLTGLNDSTSTSNLEIGGLIGPIQAPKTDVNISNIYSDTSISGISTSLSSVGVLTSRISSNSININNVQLNGKLENIQTTNKTSGLIYNVSSNKINIQNILSTTYNENLKTALVNKLHITLYDSNPEHSIIINNINMLANRSDKLYEQRNLNDDYSAFTTISNINLFELEGGINNLKLESNYSTWDKNNFNFVKKNGISRIPVQKNVEFEYSNISDITIKQELNNPKKIYEFIEPNIEAAKRIRYKSNNENIVKLDENGIIIPQSTGETTIHVESYYDGYIKDVPVSIEYVPHYIVHFDSNGETGTMESVEVEVGKDFILPKNKFTKKNAELKEWNTKADGTGTSYADLGTIPAMGDKEEITLYAIWWGEERIVTFNPNGGTVYPTSKIVRLGEDYGDLPIPTKSGHGFKYWDATDSDYSVTPFKHLYGKNLEAQWKENAYTIIYDSNGGKINYEYEYDYSIEWASETLATTYAENAKDKQIHENIFEKKDYVFKNWNTKADGTGITYTVDQVIQLSNVENDTLRLYAIWEERKFSVTFDANGGTFSDNKTSFVIDEWDNSKLNILEQPTRIGYTFKGFYTLSNGGISIEQYIEKNGINKDGLTFYAKWEVNELIVTFNSNNATGTMNNQRYYYDISQKINKNTFTKTGHKFKEWNTKADGSGTSYTNEQEIQITENITLYAQWIPNTYKLTFNSNSGTGSMNTQEFTYDISQKINKNTFTKAGHKFKEWNTKADGTGTAYANEKAIKLTKNLTLYAIWVEEYSYIINKYSFDDNKKYIDKIDINTSADDFKKNIKLNIGYNIDVDSKTIEDRDLLYTGGKTKIYKNNNLIIEYTNIIRGEVTGDGKINYLDYVNVYNHIQKVKHPESDKKELKNEYLISADMSGEGKINYLDYVQIYNKIKELKGEK